MAAFESTISGGYLLVERQQRARSIANGLSLTGAENTLPENRGATYPGEILKEEFLVPNGIAQVAFAQHIGVPLQRVNEIIRGRRGITPETSWLFSQALGATPQFWMNLQNAYHLANIRTGW